MKMTDAVCLAVLSRYWLFVVFVSGCFTYNASFSNGLLYSFALRDALSKFSPALKVKWFCPPVASVLGQCIPIP